MAKEYFEKLSNLINELKIEGEVSRPMKIKHFLSGAALYVNKTMCVSWSPVGLAFKFPEQEVNDLIANGEAKRLKYFAKGHLKKGYALFEYPNNRESSKWRKYFIKATQTV